MGWCGKTQQCILEHRHWLIYAKWEWRAGVCVSTKSEFTHEKHREKAGLFKMYVHIYLEYILNITLTVWLPLYN